MTKEELLSFTNRQIRSKKDLFETYISLYKNEKGRKPSCASCSFNSVLNAWRNEGNQVSKMVDKNKTNMSNTFILRNPKKKILVPFTNGRILDINSPDELALIYLNQKGKFVNLEARRAVFEKLPLEEVEEESEITLAELREMHPEIKARSKEDFLEKLSKDNDE